MPDDSSTTFDVYLGADVADELGVGSPIETEQIDYYDSGIWLGREGGRDFYPYRHVLRIRERPASGEDATGDGEGAETEE